MLGRTGPLLLAAALVVASAGFAQVDPHVTWSTYMGGSGGDNVTAVAADPAGNVFVAGYTTSADFPTDNGFDASYGGGDSGDAFVAKISSAGQLLWSTFLGGSGSELAWSVALDPSGAILVAGQTGSTDLPANADLDDTLGGPEDAFAAKISSAGQLLWLRYLGGSQAETGEGVGADADGNVFVVGSTFSDDFPTGSGGFDTSRNGDRDGFVTKLDSDGQLLWSAYLGGVAADMGEEIAVDQQGAAFVTGYTESGDFPSANGFDASLGGAKDAYVAKISSAGQLLWSTYLGGSGDNEWGYRIMTDASGSVVAVGVTSSSDFPTSNGFDTTYNNSDGGFDAFVTKIGSSGQLLWSTYLGGSGTEYGSGVAFDANDNVVVAGETSSTDFPTNEAFDSALDSFGDAFVAVIAAAGTGIVWSSYLGGDSSDSGWDVAVAPGGAIWTTGNTGSSDFPHDGGFGAEHYGGWSDGFVTRIETAGADTTGPKITEYTPSGTVLGKTSHMDVTFNEPVNVATFTTDDASLAGPGGAVDPISVAHVSGNTFRISFPEQTATGAYAMTVGPSILDTAGNAMDQDQDGSPNAFAGAFALDPCGPRVTAQAPTGPLSAEVSSVDHVDVTFDKEINTATFTIDDVTLARAADGANVGVTGVSHVENATYRVEFGALTDPGWYTLTVGPDIRDQAERNLDQDQDGTDGPAYTGAFALKTAGPAIVSHSPVETAAASISSLQFEFSRAAAYTGMDQTSFDPAADVLSFTGPDGDLEVTGFTWVDGYTLELSFDAQTVGGTYRMALGPQILDTLGRPLDQDGDLTAGETSDDHYTAATILAPRISGNISEDAVWGNQVVVYGTVSLRNEAVLTIRAGTIVKFEDNAELNIATTGAGRLVAEGTTAAPVVFTSIADDTAGGDDNDDGDATTPDPGDWQGLTFGNGALTTPNSLENVEIRYAQKAVHASSSDAAVTLSGAVLRNGVYGVYVYTPYVEIEAENCLVVDNDCTGVFVRADSRGAFRNCTIVGNGFQGSGWSAAGMHLGGSTLTLENTIVAFNANGLHHSGDPPAVTVRYCNFHNPDGQEIVWDGAPARPDLGQDGNSTADPLFVDRNAGNYELAPGSPAVDSARAHDAPDLDILGRTRFDDAGAPNMGVGHPAYMDMGVYERRETSRAADLAVTSVSDPDPERVAVNGAFTVRWTVKNEGAEDAAGPWQDKVYLSADPYVDSGDQVIETRTHAGTLTSHDSYAETLNATGPDQAGVWYVLVRTNADAAAAEGIDANNVLCATRPLAVDLPLLEPETALEGSISQGEWDFFRFEAAGSGAVRFALDSQVVSGAVHLYVRRAAPPTASNFDAAATANQPDQTARLFEPLAGTYYVGVYASRLAAEPVDYSLSAEPPDLEVCSVSPNQAANTGKATLRILGDGFGASTQAALTGSDRSTIPGEETCQDATTLFATFDLAGAGAAAGVYDLVLTNPDRVAVTLENALTVVGADLAQFDAELALPAMARPGRVLDLRVDCRNTGKSDLRSPLLRLAGSSEECEWRISEQDEWAAGAEFSILALSAEGEPTVMRPGQTEQLTVQLRVPFGPDRVTVSLSSTGVSPTDGSTDAVDWDELEAAVRPGDFDAEEWAPVFARLKAQLGSTWGDYVEALRGNADAWAQAGRLVYNVNELFGMELDKAHNNPSGVLGGTVMDADSGLPVADVEVSLLDADGAVRGVATTTEHGEFWIGRLAAGAYSIEVAGCLVEAGGALELTGPAARVAVTAVRAGEIVGAVTAPSGDGVADALVTAAGPNGESMETFTDAEGMFRFAPVAAGDWDLEVRATGYVTEGATHVAVADDESSYVAVSLHPGAVVSGYVTDSGGAPLAGATVYAPSSQAESQTVVTDGDGHYEVAGVAPGTCSLVVRSAGDALTRLDVESVGLNATVSGADVRMDAGVAVSGTVRNPAGTPVEGALVGFQALGGGSPAVDVSDGAGGFDVRLAPGSYRAHLSHFEYGPAEHDVTVPGGGLSQLSLALTQPGRDDAEGAARPRADRGDDPMIGDKRTFMILTGMAFYLSGRKHAAEHLWHYVNGSGAPIGYDPSDPLSQKIMVMTNTNCPFPRLRNSVRDKIRNGLLGWAPQSGEDIPFLGGQATDDGKTLAFYPQTSDETFAFGGMQKGSYKLGNPKITRNGDTVTVSGTVDYYFMDKYEFDDSDVNASIWDRWARDLEDAGKAKGYNTYVHIEDYYSETYTYPGLDDYLNKINGELQDDGRIGIYTSHTPEDKFGPAGYDAEGTPEGSEARWVKAGQDMAYRIEFWNKEDAPVPTQDALVEDTLDPNLFDLETFRFTDFGFLKWDVPIDGGQAVDRRVDLRPDMNLAVEVTASIDLETGKVRWLFHCVDPLTGEYPDDPMTGFLPPFNPDTGYETGWVEFQVRLKDDLPTGTQIQNQAFVEFDLAGDLYDHPAPKGGPWVNTVDNAPPAAAVSGLRKTGKGNRVTLSLQGSDANAGFSFVDIFAAADDGVTQFWSSVRNLAADFAGEWDAVYSFFVRGKDAVGNVEQLPDTPAATVWIPQWAFPIQVANADPDAVFAALDNDGLAGWDNFDEDAPAARRDQGAVYFAGPDAEHEQLAYDCQPTADKVEWVLSAAPAGRAPVTLSWDSADVPHARYLWLAEVDDNDQPIPSTFTDLRYSQQLDVSSAGEWLLTYSTQMTAKITVEKGWNLVAMPVDASDPAPDTVFRDLAVRGTCRRWDRTARNGGDYVPATALSALQACWIYCWGPGAMLVTGDPATANEFHIDPGWNLIGVTRPALLPDLVAIRSRAYWWDAELHAYVPLSAGGALHPGRGYWIYSTSSFTLILPDAL